MIRERLRASTVYHRQWTAERAGGPFDPAVFLDRDGVINRDSPDYITSFDAFEFLPGSIEAIARLKAAGFTVFVITNQSAIHRGLLTLSTLAEIHRHLLRSVEDAGGHIQEIYYCPHRPDENCICRKPLPAMILSASRKYGLDLSSAIMIGDKGSDIACGQNAGCGLTIQVGDAPFSPQDPVADHRTTDLFDAVHWILSHYAP